MYCYVLLWLCATGTSISTGLNCQLAGLHSAHASLNCQHRLGFARLAVISMVVSVLLLVLVLVILLFVLVLLLVLLLVLVLVLVLLLLLVVVVVAVAVVVFVVVLIKLMKLAT